MHLNSCQNEAFEFGKETGYNEALEENSLAGKYVERLRKNILRNINHLDSLLVANTKSKHIPDNAGGKTIVFTCLFTYL